MNEISVIIKTYNRCDSLKDTLNSVLAQNKDIDFDYEVIVVDNNSNDNTKDLVTSYIKKFENKLKYLFEPKQGRPYALNTGIKEAKKDIIAFTDDDCIIAEDYFKNLSEIFQKHGPEIGFVGGRILPLYLNENKPGWFNDYFTAQISLDYGGKSFFVDRSNKKLFAGANFACKKELFYSYGMFDTKMAFAHDTEICIRFLDKEIKGLYCPQLKVYHKITSEMIKPKYFYKWFYRRGKYYNNIKYFTIKSGIEVHCRRNILFWVFSDVFSPFMRSFLSANKSEATMLRCKAFFYLGWIVNIIKEFGLTVVMNNGWKGNLCLRK